MDCVTCPDCNSSKVKVKDSRSIELFGFKTKRRRRHCLDCNNRYNTIELPEIFVKDVFGGSDNE